MAEATFDATSNPTSIIFATANSESASAKLKIDSQGNFLPLANNVYNIGSSNFRFNNVYSTKLNTDQLILSSGSAPSPTTSSVYNLSGVLHYQNNPIAILPSGGTSNQILQKVSDTSYDLQWIDNYATEVHAYVKNTTGQSLSKGQAVYINGAQGDHPTIALAIASGESTSSKTLGLLKQDLAINEFGFVVTEGTINQIDTSLAGSAGDPIWLSPTTPGGLIYGLANKPSAPNHLVFLGYVVVKQQNNGKIFVKVQNGFELEELHNVAISGVTNGQFLQYNSASGLWTNVTVTPGGGGGTTISNYGDNRLLTSDGTTTGINAESNVVIDSSGNVGIGTSSPSSHLHVLNTTTSEEQVIIAEVGGGFSNGAGISFRRSTVEMGRINADYFEGMTFHVTPGAGAAATERIRITSDGNVGIGTTSPTLNTNGTVLHIHNSTASRASMIRFTNNESGSTATDGLMVGKWSDGTNYIYDYDNYDLILGAHNGNKVRIHSVGTSFYQSANGTPSLGSKNFYAATFENLSAGYGLAIGGVDTSTGAASIQAQNFTTSNAYNLILQPLGGDVGIGTNTPLRKLTISGGGFAFVDSGGASRTIHWGNTDNTFPVTISGNATTGNCFLTFNTNTFGNGATERMRIDSTGSAWIKTSRAWNDAVPTLNIGNDGDGRLQTRHVWGKNAGSTAAEHLFLQHGNTSQHVQIGATGGGNNLYVAGDIYTNGYFTGNLVLNASNYSSYALPLSGGTISGNLTVTGSVYTSTSNGTGGGIRIGDDGDIVDLNDTYCSMRFSSGVRIFSANKSGSAVITLGSNGTVTATTFSGSLSGNASTATTATTATNWGSYGGVPAAGTSFGNANTIGRSDANGYTYFSWINTVSGDSGGTQPTRIYASTDNFIRYHSLATFKAHMGLTGKNTFSRAATTGDTNYWTGSMGWSYADFNAMLDWGSGFTDVWDNPANAPFTGGHFQGIQALHYANGSARYGWQIICHAGNTDLMYARGVWGGAPSTWRKVVVGDGRNHRGATRLYRRDEDTDYSVQTYWSGSRWRLYGYVGDTAHADTHVGYADATAQTNFSNLTINSSQVLHAGNYNSYSPTLTGGNASGTWGISITGNCASASQLNGIAASNYFRVDGSYPNGDMNAPVEGYWHVASNASNLPNLNTDNDPNKPLSTIYAYGHRWDYDHAGDGNWVAQFYSPTSSDAGLWFRQRRSGTWQTWRKFVDTQTMGIALFGMEGASFTRDYMGGIILTVNRISAGVYEVYMAPGGFGLINVATSTIFHTTYTYSNGRILTYNAAGTPTDSRYISIISVDTF
jgi:hypothetical protein